MRKLITISLIAMNLIFSSCGSDDSFKYSPDLTVMVVEYGFSEKIENADVIVYKSFEDLQTKKNKVASGRTDKNGKIIFKKNIEKNVNYFIDVEKGCMNNYTSMYIKDEINYKSKTNSEVKESQLAIISLKETGTIKLTNKKSNGVIAKINNVAIASIATNETITIDYLPTFMSGLKILNANDNSLVNTIFNDFKSTCGDTKEYTIK